ncbi:hypothetical protein DFLDMN_000720 [Cupriavidus sp. H19C3]|uniref:hypothetical protein n=1 Tax=Cupriavidus sp. H19C3 TaxID=3241603 RepID=UPI003BF80BE2
MGIIESVQQYDLNIQPGGAQNIDVAGDRIQFLSAVDPFAKIEIRPNYAQGNISLRPGQGFRFSEQVTRWVVFNRGSVPLQGFLLIGSGDFFDQRIAGTVDVIDGGKARTMGGLAFSGYAYQTAGGALYPHVELWNPAGNTKNLFVEQVSVITGGTLSSGVGVRGHNGPLSTIFGNPASKKIGATNSSAELRVQSSATLIGATNLMAFDKALRVLKFSEPIQIAPGCGLIVLNGLANVGEDIGVNFEFYEEAF